MHIKQHNKREAGQGLVEYALILVLVAIAAIIALTLFGGRVSIAFEESYLAISYPQFNELVDHCMEGAGQGQINSLKSQASSNPDVYINRVNGLTDDGSISRACGKRMIAYAGSV